MALHRSRWSGRRVAIPTVIVAAVLLAATGGIAAAVAPANAASATWDPDTVITDAPGAASSLDAPNDVRYTRSGALLVADFAGNGVLRRDPDGTWSVLRRLEDRYPFLRLARHRASRGIADALRTGYLAARGSVLVFYPADLQFMPEDIPRLAEHFVA